MKKIMCSTVICLILFAASAFAQSGRGLAEIEKESRSQEAKLATVALVMLHFDITAAAGRAIRASEEFLRLNKKIQQLSADHPTACAQLPTLPYRQVLREAQVSATHVVELMANAPALIQAGGTPSEGMVKLLAGDLPKVMQNIAGNSAELQKSFSDMETSCAKKG